MFVYECFTDCVDREEGGEWREEEKLEFHTDWVRDVAWAPSVGLPRSIIASCSQVNCFLLDPLVLYLNSADSMSEKPNPCNSEKKMCKGGIV